MSDNTQNYGADQIQKLEGVHAVRKRPGMYIGDTNRSGLHHLIYEITDNSVDEALAGYCDTITIQKHSDNSISITDNGRGIPVAVNAAHGISALRLVFEDLHAGGKFGGGGYKVSGGLHGVGATVTNALSEYLTAQVKRDGHLYEMKYQKGEPLGDIQIVGEVDENETGTMVRFKPDDSMFPEAFEEDGETNLSIQHIRERIKRTAYLTPKLRLVLIDEDGSREEFYSENGIVDYVKEVAPSLYTDSVEFEEDEEMLATDIEYFKGNGDFKSPYDGSIFNAEVEIAFAYQNKFFDTNILSFANNVNTALGGKHVYGFEQAFYKFVNQYNQKELKNNEVFLKEDILEGLNVVISFKTEDPKFSDQTKQKLSTGAAQTLCYETTKNFLEEMFKKNPEFESYVIKRAQSAKKMREQIEKKRNEVQKSNQVSMSGGKPAKLADCISKDKRIREIYLVEGDSAGGSAKNGRNRNFQAILPLKGKILNAMKQDSKRVDDSEEVKNLRMALKAGADEDFDLDKLSYNKIIIMCDADVDGAHIATLLLTYFIVKMPELIKAGHVYLAQPPLYVLKSNTGGSKTKPIYVQNDEELKKYYVNGALPRNLTKQRFKGLGEMNPEELWETTMNPENRSLLQVEFKEEYTQDVNKVFEDLMGVKVEARRKFIFDNAINVDIDY